MNQDEFCQGIKTVAQDIVVNIIINDILEIGGRKASQAREKKMSLLYQKMPDEDKKSIQWLIKESIINTLFRVFCIFDGATFIEDTPEKTEFKLYAEKDGKRVLLNDPDGEELHDVYMHYVRESERADEET